MANGEEKYLPVRDRGPQRKFVRDFVDAGWHAGELLMPLMLVVIPKGLAAIFYAVAANRLRRDEAAIRTSSIQ